MTNQTKSPLVILGAGPTHGEGVAIARHKGAECWGCNYMTDPELTMLFQMHGDSFVKARFVAHYLEHPPKVPLIMQHKWAQMPTSEIFPMAEQTKFFGFDRMLRSGQSANRPYHACSMSYMLALAIMMGRYDVIHLYGVDFYSELRHESTYERPSVEFYMGYAAAKGITIDIPKNSRLLTTSDNHRQIYGLEWNPELSHNEIGALSQIA
jgi:hypothetical protein